MRVLLVDDEYEKVREISRLLHASFPDARISHESTAHAGRMALRSTAFDLLVIDLNLPAVVGSAPDREGGIAFFDLIGLDGDAHLPSDVLFVTGREDLIEEAAAKCIERGVMLCRYTNSSNLWKDILLGRMKFIALRRARAPFEKPVDVAIVTALRRPELEAVLQLPYAWGAARLQNDPTTYHVGSLSRSDRNISVVAACAQRKGMASAAALACRVASVYRPRFLLMLGICAGVKGRTNFGDVIIADPAWDWGSGKQSQTASGSPVFQASPYQRPLNTKVSQLASEMADDPQTIQKIRSRWKGTSPPGELTVRVGPMASGASVVADSSTAAVIAAQQRDLLAIEMEAYAVMAAAEYSPEPVPIAVVIKSVCDHADPDKNDNWQEFASQTSASFADLLLRNPDFI